VRIEGKRKEREERKRKRKEENVEIFPNLKNFGDKYKRKFMKLV
jgi:hypothetical protein